MTTTTNPAQIRVADLDHLDDETFRLVVDADLRRRAHKNLRDIDPDVSAALRTPAFVDRWLTALLTIRKSIEGQLRARANEYDGNVAALNAKRIMVDLNVAHQPEDLELQEQRAQLAAEEEYLRAQYLQGNTATLRFQTGLDERILEARAQRVRLLGIDLVAELEDENIRLRTAIADHRRDNHRGATAADVTLWRFLD